MTTGTRKMHDFCWINLMTPKAADARAFFADLFGWTYGDMGMPGGQIIQVDGRAAGAMMDLDAGVMPPGTPPAIGVMVRVASADETIAKVASLGGRAEPAWDVAENGRMGACFDPNGAVFGIWQPKSKLGFEHDSHAHGAPTWFETITSDEARALPFYTALFGWTVDTQRPFPGMTYHLLKLDGVQVGGLMQRTARMGDVPSHWAVTFAVKSADAIAKRVTELGGELCLAVHELEGVGRFALLKSPQGVSFHIVEWKM